MFHFHTSWRQKKPVFCVLMRYRNGTLIWNGLMLTNSSFFNGCTSIFNIIHGSWAFDFTDFCLIRAGNKKIICFLYLLWKVHVFLGETQNGMKNSLSASEYSIQNKITFNVFRKILNLGLLFLLCMGQNFILQWLLLCFI